jgi:hypothetical protein
MEVTENGNFHLFAAKQKTEKRKISVCFLQMEKRKFVFLSRQMINGS